MGVSETFLRNFLTCFNSPENCKPRVLFLRCCWYKFSISKQLKITKWFIYSSCRKQPKTFAFDHCFFSTDPKATHFATQEMVFDSVGRDILDNAFQGYNACIFAYGQTGNFPSSCFSRLKRAGISWTAFNVLHLYWGAIPWRFELKSNGISSEICNGENVKGGEGWTGISEGVNGG